AARHDRLGAEIWRQYFVRERSRLKEHFQMIDGFIAGTMSEYKKPNELLLVTATAVALDNVRGYRFRRAANLAALFIHLELRQVLECHAMNSNRHLSRQRPNLEISIAHRGSRILHLVSHIPHYNSSSISTGVRSTRLPYCNEIKARTCVEAASNSEISFCALPRKKA